jgi:hypothetical protein
MPLQPIVHDGLRTAYRLARPRAFRLAQERRTTPLHAGTSYRGFDATRSIFVHIPKTAGVSVCEALYGTSVIGHARLRHYQVVYDWATYASYFKFAFVRNPWDRLVSAYEFLRAGGWHAGDRRWAAEHVTVYGSFEAFVRKGLPRPEVMAWRHFQPQRPFLADPLTGRIGVDFVGRFESLQADFRTIAERIGIRAELPHRNRSRAATPYRDAYTPATAAVVRRLYARDVDAFGYVF